MHSHLFYVGNRKYFEQFSTFVIKAVFLCRVSFLHLCTFQLLFITMQIKNKKTYFVLFCSFIFFWNKDYKFVLIDIQILTFVYTIKSDFIDIQLVIFLYPL